MTAQAISAAPVDPTLVVAAGQVQVQPNPVLVGLAPPLLSETEPSDVLGMLMAMMERMASQGVKESTQSIQANQDKLEKALEKFQAKLEEIARKAEKKEKNDGWGFLGDVCSAVCDFVGDAFGECFGNLTDFAVDLVRCNFDIVVGLIKGENFGDLLAQELKDMGTKGKVGDTVHGAMRGITDFYRDLGNALTGAAEALANGKNVGEALKDLGGDMWSSFVNNIIENEDVMEVLGAIVKTVAVAGAVASGGALGLVAAGLFALAAVDEQTNACDCLFGDKAGKWVSLSLNVAAATCLGFAAANSTGLLKSLHTATTIVSGTLSVGQGIHMIEVAAEQREAKRDSADLQELMNWMAQLQRVIDGLLGEAEEKTENRDRIREGGAELYQLQGESFELTTAGLRA